MDVSATPVYTSPPSTSPSPPRVPEARIDTTITDLEAQILNENELELNQDELELLSNWCSTTYESFSSAYTFDPKVWKSIIIRTALSHPALLEGIFALSALQLAYRSTRHDDLLNSAYTHKKNAQSGLHELETADRGVPFMLCNILVVFEFAGIQRFPPSSSSFSSSSSSALDDMSQIFLKLRASTTNLAELVNETREQKVAKEAPSPAMPSTFGLAILMLRRLNTQHDDLGKKPIYDQAINQLASCLEYMAWGSKPGIVELSWFLIISDEMMGLIADRQPMALTILAHYCVILYHLRNQWWVADLGTGVLKDISHLLGPEQLPAISWVMDVTGVCPST